MVSEEKKELKEIPLARLIHIISRFLKHHQILDDDKEIGLTPMQKHVLKFILFESLHRDVYQKDIEDEFHIRRSTVTGIIQLMEKNGFINRESVSKDARLKRLVPTKKSEDLRNKIIENIIERDEHMVRGISEEELKSCKNVLLKILDNLTDSN